MVQIRTLRSASLQDLHFPVPYYSGDLGYFIYTPKVHLLVLVALREILLVLFEVFSCCKPGKRGCFIGKFTSKNASKTLNANKLNTKE